MKPGDYFLLGADRVKEKFVLDAAYNDAQGITAEFNLNVLNVLNRELNANFKLNSSLRSRGDGARLSEVTIVWIFFFLTMS